MGPFGRLGRGPFEDFQITPVGAAQQHDRPGRRQFLLTQDGHMLGEDLLQRPRLAGLGIVDRDDDGPAHGQTLTGCN